MSQRWNRLPRTSQNPPRKPCPVAATGSAAASTLSPPRLSPLPPPPPASAAASTLPPLAASALSPLRIRLQNVTRLCHTRSMVTVNGQFPGPNIVVREGDRIVVKVVNHVQNNITIHWHGIRQLQSQWADGPAYVTQCPIQTGQSYVYDFTITGQRGTLWWHAHQSWLRATVYGALIILSSPSVAPLTPSPNPTN